MKILKNYFAVFILAYLVSILVKFIFAFYGFDNISFENKIYAIFYGYKFDLALCAILALLATLFDFSKKFMLGFSIILLILVFAFGIGDIMYFSDSSRHISYEIKDTIKESVGLIGTAINDYLPLLLGGIFGGIILIFIFYKILNFTLEKIKFNKFYLPLKLLVIGISVFFIRGEFQDIPLNPGHSYKIGDSTLAMIALNPSYNAIFQNIRSKGDIKQSPKFEVKNEELLVKNLYKNKILPYEKPTLDRPNVVIFFLESWSAAFFKPYGGKYDVAPRLSEILEHSIRPKAMIANGHRTVEGVFSTLASFQNPLGKAVGRSSLEAYSYESLMNPLNKMEYYSAFFQGSNADTAAASIALKLGFKDSFGRRDVKERIYEENRWGVHDEDLYNFVLSKAKSASKPFVFGINGATTHDSDLPKAYKMVHFSDDEKENVVLNTYHFSDESTYNFIKKMEKLYPNTVFVILADHCARLPSGAGDFINYMIPFAIYSPKLQPKYIDEFVSQRDIAPTLMDLIVGDYKKQAPGFSGKSLLRDDEFFGDFYSNGALGIVKNQVLYKIVNNNLQCFDVSKFKPKAINCPKNADLIADEIKAFTNISQDLLFSGKTKEFSKFR